MTFRPLLVLSALSLALLAVATTTAGASPSEARAPVQWGGITRSFDVVFAGKMVGNHDVRAAARDRVPQQRPFPVAGLGVRGRARRQAPSTSPRGHEARTLPRRALVDRAAAEELHSVHDHDEREMDHARRLLPLVVRDSHHSRDAPWRCRAAPGRTPAGSVSQGRAVSVTTSPGGPLARSACRRPNKDPLKPSAIRINFLKLFACAARNPRSCKRILRGAHTYTDTYVVPPSGDRDEPTTVTDRITVTWSLALKANGIVKR